MTWAGVKHAAASAYHDVLRHHALQVAAALSYYFILAIFPGLILLSAVMASVPLPDLFGHVLGLMARLLPPNTMTTVQSVLLSVLTAKQGAWVSVGTLGLLWVTSAAFDALVEALDIAYDVGDPRPLWKTRMLGVVLGAITAIFLTSALGVMILGPRFGTWLADRISMPQVFVMVWPFVHWTIAIAFTVLAVEVIYFLAPNVKQRFVATLPGALLSVSCWLGLSYLLGIYFRHYADFDRIYGTLGGFIVFMVWLYWTSFALLVGAELNAELAKQSARGAIQAREKPGIVVPMDHAA